jgi:hypothetical protein
MKHQNPIGVQNIEMTSKILLFVLILILSPLVYSQQNEIVILSTTKNNVRIDVSKPSVYITFEHYGEGDFLWLRMHNNSRWTISFYTDESFYGFINKPSTWSVGRDEFGLLDGVEVKPTYFIESLLIEEKVNNLSCTRSQSWLPSGRSVIFKLLRKNLRKFNTLYITFGYEWETDGFEPEHRVRFDGTEPRMNH